VHGPVRDVPGDHALALAVLGHDEVDGEVLDEELGVSPHRLAIERVQDGVPRPVGGGAGALHRRALAELGHVAAEGALVDAAVLGAAEGHAVMLELDHGGRRLAGQVLHGVHVAQPVRSLDGIVHVPLPVVGAHVLQAGGDAALGGDRVAARREELGDAGRLQPLLGHAERRAQARPTGAYDDDVVAVVDELVCGHPGRPILSAIRRSSGAARRVRPRRGLERSPNGRNRRPRERSTRGPFLSH
jgi:hypothetical protein